MLDSLVKRLSPLSSVCTGLCVLLIAGCGARKSSQGDNTNLPIPPPAKTWTDIPVANPKDRIIIHYHRQDEAYAGVNLWTWDGYNKNSPSPNYFVPAGQDRFGSVFEIDRAKYGESDKIGLIPRIGNNWNQKDGGDKFWYPALGNEVWLVCGQNEVYSNEPDISPKIELAFIDARDRIVLQLNAPAPTDVEAALFADGDLAHPMATATLLQIPANSGSSPSLRLALALSAPLDLAGKKYCVQLKGFGRPVALVPRGVLDDPELYFDADAKLGATYSPASTTFRLFAPTATGVSLVLDDEATGTKGRSTQALKSEPRGIWDLTVQGDLRGKFYAYSLEGPGFDPSREIVDPYAVNAVASTTRGRITDIAAPLQKGPGLAAATDHVIYEMHVRDFSIDPNSGAQHRGLYLGFTEPGTHLPGDASIRTTLDHLVELGVTDVELLPVADFKNDESSPTYNWGYDPMEYFSPEGMYATNPNDDSRVLELAALIEALHSRGIGVIMDVVYNHTADIAPLSSIVPGYYYRHLDNGALANGSRCGNEFRTEAPMGRKLILDSLKFWTKQYGMDGYRFDLMAIIDQETMKEAAQELRAINPNIILYGEPWVPAFSPLSDKSDKSAIRALEPIGAFNDDFRDALHGRPADASTGWMQDGSHREDLKKAMLISDWCATPGQSINYMTCHDDLTLWDKLKISMPGASDELLAGTTKLGFLALLTSEGVPFIQGGTEFSRTKGGDNNSYISPDSVNEIDWSLKKANSGLVAYVRDLIALRKAHPVFRLRTRVDVVSRLRFVDVPSDKVILYTLNGANLPGETWTSTCVVMNSDNSAAVDVALPAGTWSLAVDENGANAGEPSFSGSVHVSPKTGLILWQRGEVSSIDGPGH
ncbi:MAG TPA: type I pullulanase [Candidatus Methylacidiphilales bacterium]|jgi:pullulanase|nr:type I pullulanase [Candidatus Methylacidiphilales bacterium]